MAKFKVGDRVRCAEISIQGIYYVPATCGTIVKVEEGDYHTYLVRVDTNNALYNSNVHDGAVNGEWWYAIHEVSPITTTIEWYTPDECLPYDGAKVFYMSNGYWFCGTFIDFVFQGEFGYANPEDHGYGEVQFWAYAPEVK